MFGEEQQKVNCTLHVVDTVDSPYLSVFQPLLEDGLMSARFYDTACAALRQARLAAEGVWFVAMDLPDLPGPQFIEMLIGLSGNKLIVAVGNAYSPQEETAALSSGACQYFVKPLVERRCWAVIEAYLTSELNSEATPTEEEGFFFETRTLQR
jgi:FixJ family two-component response regulator